MDIIAKRAKIWRKDIEGKNGTFYKYSTSVSRKTEDGSFVNAYMDVRFSKKSGAPEKIENGALCDFSGFMSVDSFEGKDGKKRNTPVIIIMDVKFEGDEDGFAEAEEDIPFK
jgi:hypothetical protein